ncbi:MAG: L-histidine N(alpha)-methyltransferase [Aeromicrobium sp.]
MTSVLTAPAELTQTLIADVRNGLATAPRWLPPKYFYDDRGSALFDEITRLPEYYPTRAERALLEAHADDIAHAADARVLLELGSGSSEKTALLLDAMAEAGGLESYIPVDVSAGALRGALEALAETRPELPVHPVVADFEHRLTDLPTPGRRLVAFLGSTIGNFAPAERREFFARLGGALRPGESFLLGVDLVKDPKRLVAAYDDAAGVTAEFNRNVLRVLNRELDADFQPDAFEHVALWDAENAWMEMRLRALDAMTVNIPGADVAFDLAAGEEIRTEISAKFRRLTVESELVAAGFRPLGWWSDGDYALALARN